MQGACPKVPQQNNFSDCGLFTLQFAQSFFERPVKDFTLPIRCLSDWFKQDVVGRKRESVANLIRSLMDEHKPNHGITLPPLSFSSIRDKVDSIGQSQAEEEAAADSGQENGGKRLNDAGEEKIPGLGTGPENGQQKPKSISKDINSKCRKGTKSSSKKESLLNDSENKSSLFETNVDESTDLSSCSNTIKFLSRILDKSNSLVNSKKDPKGTPAASCERENSSPVNSEETTETLKAKSKKPDRINSSLSNSLDESRSKNNSVPLRTSENRLKSSLHLLRDSYSGSGNSDEEDELFLSKKENEPKAVENSLNNTREHSER
ncbi:UNVERIFIED_CONTAM: hypothetical protein GTU68_054165 [Idotea baltica]|nr:hypothetical protein [Idotea baltica]